MMAVVAGGGAGGSQLIMYSLSDGTSINSVSRSVHTNQFRLHTISISHVDMRVK